jgi:AraC-like DNA-binding protein
LFGSPAAQDHLTSKTITNAEYLLRSIAQSVSDFAVSVGFSGPTGSGRILKKLTDHTPSAFRRLPQK